MTVTVTISFPLVRLTVRGNKTTKQKQAGRERARRKKRKEEEASREEGSVFWFVVFFFCRPFGQRGFKADEACATNQLAACFCVFEDGDLEAERDERWGYIEIHYHTPWYTVHTYFDERTVVA